MEIEIKKVGLSELDELMQWREIVLREVFAIPQEQSMSELLAENRKYYERSLETGRHTACFAYVDGKVIGCGGVCYYQEMPSPDTPNGTCAYLMNIYTAPTMRGNGVGKAIIAWLILDAKNIGATKIYLEASDNAYSLYQEMGFQDMNNYLQYPV